MMNLKPSVEPRNAPAIVARTIEQCCRPQADAAAARQAAPDAISAGIHHPVYELGVGAIAAGGRIDQAQRSGSRYLLSKQGRVQAALEIATDARGAAAYAFRSLNEGPLVAATEQALQRADAWTGTAPSGFSLVWITPLRVGLLWVKPLDPQQAAWFWVLDPAPSGLQTSLPYSEEELFAVLRPMARANLQQR